MQTHAQVSDSKTAAPAQRNRRFCDEMTSKSKNESILRHYFLLDARRRMGSTVPAEVLADLTNQQRSVASHRGARRDRKKRSTRSSSRLAFDFVFLSFMAVVAEAVLDAPKQLAEMEVEWSGGGGLGVPFERAHQLHRKREPSPSSWPLAVFLLVFWRLRGHADRSIAPAPGGQRPASRCRLWSAQHAQARACSSLFR